jgi:glycosidase
MLYTIRQMIARRKAMDFVAKAELVWLDDLPKHVLCFWRESENGNLLALHNLSDKEVTIDLPKKAKSYRDALWLDKPAVSETITLPPYGYHWLLPVL